MIMQSVATGDAGPEVQKKFKERAEELLREGVIGFGEMTAEHFDGFTPYQYAPPDHPLYLLLADHGRGTQRSHRPAHGGGARRICRCPRA